MGVSSRPVGHTERPGRSSRAPQNDTPYYTYAGSAGKNPEQNIQVISPGSPTDEFVASLNEQNVIVLSGTPSPTASLDDWDETKKWFQKLDPEANCSLKVNKSTQNFFKSFEFEFLQPWSLTFSSASDVLLFTFGAPAVVGGETGSRMQPLGIDGDREMLTCGLDFVHTEEITGTKLKDLFTYADVAGMSVYVPSAMLDLAVTLTNKRNALWFVPVSDKRVNIRLQFQMPIFDPLQNLLADCLKGLTLKATDVIFRKQTLINCSVKADNQEVSMVAGVEFSPSTINFTFLFISSNPLTGILKWLSSLIGDETLEDIVKSILNKENDTKVLPDFTLRGLTIELSALKDPTTPRLSSFAFDIEVSANLGIGSSKNPVIFLVSYNRNSFSGGLGTLAG
ncbi:uncharacterized protein HRG_06226 [Hirsutella rhossiliensis]|uniref:Uncharacterized protein n=1 Tax=Hirsutella rhossiliensis TaxID=111463 RepID=A0A9P8N0J6_9HYPO|nr:uncharacterized protein HRG_06226 [Hirsutella rhossiliensis]KAH0963716.1 hypothetical protein HRG_06226 [Hirsutella rhossiliensis]